MSLEIAMAPKGYPKTEVTFELDASGIMHVTAKDLATGKSKYVAVKSSGGLSEADIERMINDAER